MHVESWVQAPGTKQLIQTPGRCRPAFPSRTGLRRFDGVPTSVRHLPVPLNLRHSTEQRIGEVCLLSSPSLYLSHVQTSLLTAGVSEHDTGICERKRHR